MSGLAARGMAAIRRISPRWVAALLALSLVVAACGSGRYSGERSWINRAQRAGGVDLVVTTADRTGIVTDVAVDPADWSPPVDASVHVRPGEPTALGLTWLRKGCESGLSIVVERERGQLAILLHEDAATSCANGSDPIAVVLRFRVPIDASDVRLGWTPVPATTAGWGGWHRWGDSRPWGAWR